METSSQVIEKLRKLLRLSESANEHESALALQRAQELALKHKIELASIAKHDEPASASEGPVGRQARTYRRKAMSQRYITPIISRYFNVKLVYGSGSGHKKVWYIGTRSDIEFAKYVYDFLDLEYKRLFLRACDENGWDTVSVSTRTNYYYGLYQGLNKKLHDAKQQAEENSIRSVAMSSGQSNADVANKYALAIRKNELAVQHAVRQFFPHLRSSSGGGINIRHSDAVSVGNRDGARINISRPLGASGGRNGGLLQ
jgi:hypothetical protein